MKTNYLKSIIIIVLGASNLFAESTYENFFRDIAFPVAPDGVFSVLVPYGQPIGLIGDDGVIIIVLEEGGSSDQTKYRTKTFERGKNRLSESSGILFEKYSKTISKDGETLLQDAGSSLNLVTKLGNIVWSFSGKRGGYIYIEAKLWRVALLPYGSFDEIVIRKDN